MEEGKILIILFQSEEKQKYRQVAPLSKFHLGFPKTEEKLTPFQV